MPAIVVFLLSVFCFFFFRYMAKREALKYRAARQAFEKKASKPKSTNFWKTNHEAQTVSYRRV